MTVQLEQASLENTLEAAAIPEFTLSRERALQRELRKKGPDGYFQGGIAAEEVRDAKGETHTLLHLANPYEHNMVIKTFATQCSKDEIEAIRSSILPTKEAYEMLMHMATAYELKMPLIIEGETALGKTFMIKKFTELLYGKGVEPIDFYCSGQTEVSELTAKWVPKVSNNQDHQKWRKFISTQYGQEKLNDVMQEVEEADGFSQEERLDLLTSQLQEIAEEAGISSRTSWELQPGAIPKAMAGHMQQSGVVAYNGTPGRGFILKIDEVGLAKPGVVNALLRLRGVQGGLAESIQLWENGGEIIHAGPDFWFVMSTNPPETGYLERNEIDPALARGALFIRMGNMSKQSLELAAKRICNYKLGNGIKKNPNMIYDFSAHGKIGSYVGEVLGAFHHAYVEALKQGEKGGRQQKIPATLDDMSRFSKYINSNQIRNYRTGGIDVVATLKTAMEDVYLARLADQSLKDQLAKTFEMALTHEVMGVTNIDGQTVNYAQALQSLADEHMSVGNFTPEQKEKIAEKRKRIKEQRRKALDKLKSASVEEKNKARERLRSHREKFAQLGKTQRVNEIDQILAHIDKAA